jgi:carboxymethylenebutenolidase
MKTESMKNNTLISSTRRQAIQRFLGVGYVLASSPVMSQSAIKTSAVGLSTQEVMIQRDGFKFPVYVARPEGQGNLPVMLVVSEVFGVHEYIADVARRFAHAGYCAIAPELFARQGDPGEYAQLSKLLAEVVDKVPDEQVMADLDACVQWAQEQGFNVSRLGINGFCWGGRIAWLYAAHQKKLKAAVAWYGRTTGAHSSLTPAHPLERLANLSAPVLGLYGAQDASIPLSVINDFQAKLALVGQSGVQSALQSRLVIYPDVGHAFHADYRATYNPVAAQDGWSKTLDWFKKWL